MRQVLFIPKTRMLFGRLCLYNSLILSFGMPILTTQWKVDAKLSLNLAAALAKGRSPAEKKPNLAGIVKKMFRRHDHPPQYSSVINIDTLEKSVALCTT